MTDKKKKPSRHKMDHGIDHESHYFYFCFICKLKVTARGPSEYSQSVRTVAFLFLKYFLIS